MTQKTKEATLTDSFITYNGILTGVFIGLNVLVAILLFAVLYWGLIIK